MHSFCSHSVQAVGHSVPPWLQPELTACRAASHGTGRAVPIHYINSEKHLSHGHGGYWCQPSRLARAGPMRPGGMPHWHASLARSNHTLVDLWAGHWHWHWPIALPGQAVAVANCTAHAGTSARASRPGLAAAVTPRTSHWAPRLHDRHDDLAVIGGVHCCYHCTMAFRVKVASAAARQRSALGPTRLELSRLELRSCS